MHENVSAFKFKELTVYKKAFSLSMEIFVLSKKFSDEEKYGLTSLDRFCICLQLYRRENKE
jgi:hypothetical protein